MPFTPRSHHLHSICESRSPQPLAALSKPLRVDFPQPLFPTTAVVFPARKSSVTPERTCAAGERRCERGGRMVYTRKVEVNTTWTFNQSKSNQVARKVKPSTTFPWIFARRHPRLGPSCLPWIGRRTRHSQTGYPPVKQGHGRSITIAEPLHALHRMVCLTHTHIHGTWKPTRLYEKYALCMLFASSATNSQSHQVTTYTVNRRNVPTPLSLDGRQSSARASLDCSGKGSPRSCSNSALEDGDPFSSPVQESRPPTV